MGRNILSILITCLIGGCANAPAPQSPPRAGNASPPATQAEIPAAHPLVTGRVLDAAGRPVADATVSAGTDALGDYLGRAMPNVLVTRTDSQGRYSLRLPYGGLLYSIAGGNDAEGAGGAERVVSQDQRIDLHLQSVPMTGKITGHLRTAAGGPAAGVPLSLVAEYGGRFHSITDAAGAFAFTGLPDAFLGQSAILADAPGDAVLLTLVSNSSVGLALTPPAKFHGNVGDETDGTPLAGVTVTITPSEFANGVRFTTTTDAHGNWHFDQIPPGSYLVNLDSPDHFYHPPPDDTASPPRYRIRPGETAVQNFSMDRDAHIYGTVVDRAGKPVAGALACTMVSWNVDGSNRYRWAVSDAKGHFDLLTGRVNELLFVEVGDGRFGVANRMQVSSLEPDGFSIDLRFVMPGIVHLSGTIAGPRGEPIPDVTCRADWLGVSVQSDRQGRFDLGWVSAPEARGAIVSAEPPTIAPGPDVTIADGPMCVPPAEAQHRTFYRTASQTFTAKPGHAVSVAIRLEQDPLLAIHGQIVDLDGHPLAGASAYLFSGTPDDDWIKLASGVVDDRLNTVDDIAECITDAHGHFAFPALATAGESAGRHGIRFAIGVASEGKSHKLITDVIVAPGKYDLELRIPVDPTVVLKRSSE